MASVAVTPTAHNGASHRYDPALAQHPRFQEILDTMVERARAAMPSAGDRVDKARELVLHGHVEPQNNHFFKVRSYSRPEIKYLINGSCSCEDATFSPGSWCLHKTAIGLFRRTMSALQALVQEAQADNQDASQADHTPDPAPTMPALVLPEAPASVNCHVTIAGRQVQITLRDSDETRLLTRLTALLAQYPTGDAAPAPQVEHGPDWCHKHGVRMQRNEKHGRSWYSHRLDDGQWCKGR